jgi:hypothetical protein
MVMTLSINPSSFCSYEVLSFYRFGREGSEILDSDCYLDSGQNFRSNSRNSSV